MRFLFQFVALQWDTKVLSVLYEASISPLSNFKLTSEEYSKLQTLHSRYGKFKCFRKQLQLALYVGVFFQPSTHSSHIAGNWICDIINGYNFLQCYFDIYTLQDKTVEHNIKQIDTLHEYLRSLSGFRSIPNTRFLEFKTRYFQKLYSRESS